MKTTVKLISNKPDKYITIDSIVDGPGLRMTIWFQGCAHKCKECHNPQTHSFSEGFEVNLSEVKKHIRKLVKENSFDGITFSGGDPIYQIDALKSLADFAKSLNLNIWCYTGFTFEELLKLDKIKYLTSINVLVDGKFILEQKSFDSIFRGSKNQRLINLEETLLNNKITLFNNNIDTKIDTSKTDNIFI